MTKLTPLKAIRLKCLDCSGFQPKEARLCMCIDCPIYPYRLGHNPARMGISPSLNKKTFAESVKTIENEVLNG